jgi:serine/threonine protein kinase
MKLHDASEVESWENYAARFPSERIAVAQKLWEDLTRYVEERNLPWTPAAPPGRWWLGYKRVGGYYVATIALWTERPVEFAVKLPSSPQQLDLSNPYPRLDNWWDAKHKVWIWAVPGVTDVPDVRRALDISRDYQPDTGPMRSLSPLRVRDSPRQSRAPLSTGSVVGDRYVLQEELGRGARKTVYLGLDRKINSKVAVALSGVDDNGGSEALTKWEAEVMGELRELSHVVEVFDVGVQNSHNYIVIQHMSGGTLADLISSTTAPGGGLSLASIAEYGCELAEALAEIHDHGIIHRDIQPKNVWLDKPGGRLHLGDFDLAIRSGDPESSLGHSRTTRAYMAPELTRGEVATERSDLYALGATLYEMATGQPPFSGTDDELHRLHQHVQPRRPSLLRSDIPPQLDDLILKLLAKSPSDRPANAPDVRDALVEIARPAELDIDVGSLIARGEGQHVEFKQSFRAPTGGPPPQLPAERVAEWRAKQTEYLEDECAITLAGFMNTKGGWLLIGVHDDGSIVGIEPDYKTLKSLRTGQSSEDAWELRFRDAMKRQLGDTAVLEVAIRFDRYVEGTVACVRCERGSTATWIRGTDFYVRTGNRTQKLKPQDAFQYMIDNWLGKPESPRL